MMQMGNSEPEQSGVMVAEHFVPTPTTVSPQAQAFLSRTPPVGQMTMPSADDKEAWRAFSAAADQGMTAMLSAVAAQHPAEVVRHALSGAMLYEITPRDVAAANDPRAILYIHGGGFSMGGGEASILAAQHVAGLAGIRTYSIDYRMPPDHPFPTGLEDCVEAYRWVLQRHRPESVALYGPSAGGNLAPATLLKAKALGLPMPAACVVHSPAADATESGDTYETNQTVDIVLKHRMPALFKLYADGHDLRDPLVSPIYGDYSTGFPPTMLTSGTRDLLLSSTVLLHRAMRRGGVTAELHVWEAMTHAPFFGSPEEDELYREQIDFMVKHMRA
jgi:acetyl esterase/lipase